MKKILKYILFKVKNRDIIEKYHTIKTLPYLRQDENDKRIILKLNKLLNHAYTTVPYYRNILDASDIVSNNKIDLQSVDELQKIPFLTKKIIKQQKESIFSKNNHKKGRYQNTSGGSTGEPVVFLQDRDFLVNNQANFLLIESWRGVGLYDSRLKLWGAERDTFKGTKPFTSYIREGLLNLTILNSFKMSPHDMRNYIELINKKKPKLILSYVQSIYELAKFAKKNNIEVKKQHSIHSAAGTLYDFMRDEIEQVFGCKVYNHYGSREVGAMASECKMQNGLHIIEDNNFIEVIDSAGKPCEPGAKGEIVVTTLNNYSMPLIRYKIGDVGVLQTYKPCACGCTYPKLEKVIGRTTDLFTSLDGNKIDGEYFTHLFYFVNGIKLFQVTQETLNNIVVKIVPDQHVKSDDLSKIEDKIKFVIGDECLVDFEFVDTIPKTKTGKFLYTISRV